MAEFTVPGGLEFWILQHARTCRVKAVFRRKTQELCARIDLCGSANLGMFVIGHVSKLAGF